MMFNLHMHDSMLLALLCKAPQELFVPKHRAKVQQSITIITNLSFTLRRCRWMFKLLTPFNISAFTNVDSFTFYPQNQTFFSSSRRLHQVEASVLLPHLLPFLGLNQTVDHSSQCVPIEAEAPPPTTLYKAGSLLPTAHEVCSNLKGKHFDQWCVQFM